MKIATLITKDSEGNLASELGSPSEMLEKFRKINKASGAGQFVEGVVLSTVGGNEVRRGKWRPATPPAKDKPSKKTTTKKTTTKK